MSNFDPFRMPLYFFDVQDGRRPIKSRAQICKNDAAAIEKARVVAIGVSLDKPEVNPTRYISVMNEARQEVFRAPVYSKPA